jgi:protein-tyrosine kinase
MTRLADALQRANRQADQASPPQIAVVAPPRPEARPRAVLTRHPDPPAPASTGSLTLIGLPRGDDQLTTWRTDPELVGKLVGTDGFSPAAMEQYRKLAATLHHAQAERAIKVVMTSSALPGEGKSLTSVNLALTLSESYHRRVLLIDVDLRRPTVQRIFGLPPIGGLNEGLTASQDRPIAVTRVSKRLFVLPAGRPEADPMSGLTSERMKRLFAQAAGTFDWVIVDSPPVGLLPDASLLSTLVDGVLLVIRSGKAPFALVKRTVEVITHQRILGVVMNAIDYKNDRNAGGYYEYYGGAGYYGTPVKK